MSQDDSFLHGPFAARLRQRYGSEVDPEVSLNTEAEDSPPGRKSGFSAEVLQRLATHGLKETRYRVKGEIARGGMGAILEVWDEDLRRKLAMKVVLGRDPEQKQALAEDIDPKSLGRFLEEAQVTGQLDHPGIVPVYELGLDDAGHVYFTMRLVKGRELREVFELVDAGEGDWTVTRALGMLLKVCEAMAFAHAKGVIHRDLKPANIMVGRFGEVYVMDWGLAHVLGAKDRHDVRLRTDNTPVSLSIVETERHAEASSGEVDASLYTMDGDVVGTPAYMSPEQARGQVEKLDARTDVYAMGAMLYHLLAGQMPFVPYEAKLSAHAILIRALEGPPVPLTRLAPKAPAELVAICERAMSRDLEARYADMQELADDLRAYLEHRVVKAYQTGAWAEARKWIERNQALAAALALALLLLVAGLVTSLVFKGRADDQAVIAKENERVATEHADDVLRLSASQDLQDLVAEVDELWPASPTNIAAFENWIERASAQVADLDVHREKLAGLRARALPRTEVQRLAERQAHPDFEELTFVEAEVASRRRALVGRQAGVEAELPTFESSDYPTSADALNLLAWELVDPARTRYGDEPLGLALALRALETTESQDTSDIGDTVAWGYFALGRDEDALEAMFTTLDAAPDGRRNELGENLLRLEEAVGEATSTEGLQSAESDLLALERRRAELAGRVDTRRDWHFPDTEPEARWWNNQLEKLIAGLEELEAGPLAADAATEPFGWSVPKRLAFARRIETAFAVGGDATRLWIEVTREMRAAYPGLEPTAQEGLVPLGPDPESGLWEFADLATGLVPERDGDGELQMTEDSGLVFVLLPGGTFTMGAQRSNPSGANYDPNAQVHETPPHEVALSPFFLSKYEMTQAQWLRVTGRNPSSRQPPSGQVKSLLHPVEQVSWDASFELCRRFELSIPSEAQWEYAARAGTTSIWWTGSERASLVDAVNLADQSARREGASWPAIEDWPELDDGFAAHAPVDEFRPNSFGLHNVLGNVFEWCHDAYAVGAYSRHASLDPSNVGPPGAARVIRGGSFLNAANSARSATRFEYSSDDSGPGLGLRPARAFRSP